MGTEYENLKDWSFSPGGLLNNFQATELFRPIQIEASIRHQNIRTRVFDTGRAGGRPLASNLTVGTDGAIIELHRTRYIIQADVLSNKKASRP